MRWCREVSMPGGHAGALSLAPIVTASFCSTSLVLPFQNYPFKLKFQFKLANSSSLALTHHKQLLPAALPQTRTRTSREDDFDFVVVNFYHFVFIQDPQAEVAKHRSFLELQDLDINGRLYLNEQGINAQYSGPSKDALAYVNWLREDSRFSDILVQLSPSENGHTFPALKLRYKPSLVQFEGDMSHLSLLDPSMRAIPLSPSEWKERLEAINKTDLRAKDYHNRNSILLDVRNGYEWDIGHFRGAQRPSVDCFRNTSFGLSQEEVGSLSDVSMPNVWTDSGLIWSPDKLKLAISCMVFSFNQSNVIRSWFSSIEF